MNGNLLYNLKNDYHFDETIVFRTPFSSFKNHKGEKSLSLLFNDEVFKEAIYLASPVLYESVIRHLDRQADDPAKDYRLFQSVHNYKMRMQTRSTPYGLFAGCGLGSWGTKSAINIDGHFRHTRIDMNILFKIAEKLVANEHLRNHSIFFSNNSIYKVGGKIRFIELISNDDYYRCQTSQVDSNKYLECIIKFATRGKNIFQLVEFLEKKGISSNNAKTYLNELISGRILISEFEPNITGEEYTSKLLKRLSTIHNDSNSAEIAEIILWLKELTTKVKKLDNQIGNDIGLYRDILSHLNAFDIKVSENTAFHTDLFFKTSTTTLNSDLKAELLKAMNFLNKIVPSETNYPLKSFTSRYVEKYQDAKMPLLHVLDNEIGIGYLNYDQGGFHSLLQNIIVPEKNQDDKFEINSARKILIAKIQEAIKAQNQILTLHDSDFSTVNYTTDQFSNVIAIIFNLIDNSDKIHLSNCWGYMDLISRFGHGHKEIGKLSANLASYEQTLEPDILIAEIVHQPHTRAGNILAHPKLMKHEIPCLSLSGVSQKFQVRLENILIKVEGGDIFLEDKITGKEVLPRLSAAHEYRFNSLPVYHFLCDLQQQYHLKGALHFETNELLKIFKFIPRIEYGKTVLSRKTWLLEKGDFEEILSINTNQDGYKIERWAEKWGLPQRFVIADGDNELLIDLKNSTNILTLINVAKKRVNIKLKEFLFFDGSKNSSHKFSSNECLAFLKRNQGRKGRKFPDNISSLGITRKFILGDDWVYYKVYCGVKYADDILINVIYPFITRIEEENLISEWFFIRYHDQNSHLRLRFKVKDFSALNKLILEINRLFKFHIDNYLIDKLVTDTYDRELERYGALCIEEVESIFNIDSRTVLKILALIKTHADPDIRWLCALRLMNDTLDVFDFSLKQKEEIALSHATSFFKEHNGDSQLKMQLNKVVREKKDKVLAFLNSEEVKDPRISELLDVIGERKILIRAYIQKIISTKNKEKSDLDELVFGLIHMTVNRLFISKQRTHEMVLYQILANFYKTQTALLRLTNNANHER